MLKFLFSVIALAMMLTIIYRLFYGIIVLVFQPSEHSFKKLQKSTAYLLIAIIVYVVCVFLTNTFLANTNLYALQFSFGDIAQTVGRRLQRRM
jgi:type III secretory pathway component EscS